MNVRIEQRAFIARHVVEHFTVAPRIFLIAATDVRRRRPSNPRSPHPEESRVWPNLHSGAHSRAQFCDERRTVSSCNFTRSCCSSQPPRSSWRLTPKQDFLVCFFGGNLLLGATRSGALEQDVSVPPRPEELTEVGRRDWATGIELIRTCMATHDTQTFVPRQCQGRFVD